MKKHYLDRVPLSLLDTFLVLFFAMYSIYVSNKYFGIELYPEKTILFALLLMTIVPIICKTISLMINKAEDKKKKVKYHIFHLLSAYIIFYLTVFIFDKTLNLNSLVVLIISIMVLEICYVLFGEYYFRLRIVPERIRDISDKLKEDFSKYDNQYEEFLFGEDGTKLDITITVSQEDHLIDFNLKDIVVEGEDVVNELFEESDTER